MLIKSCGPHETDNIEKINISLKKQRMYFQVTYRGAVIQWVTYMQIMRQKIRV